jgi:hypothetical protein
MMKKVSISLVIFLICALFAWSMKLYQQPTFNSQAIKEIYEILPESIRIQLYDYESNTAELFYIDTSMICDNSKVIARFNQYNELEHLGLHVFNITHEDRHLAHVFDYIERLRLIACLSIDNPNLRNKLYQERVEMKINGITIDNPKDLMHSITSVNANTPFSLYNDINDFIATWSIDYFNHIEFKFPNNYINISGKDKYELENDFVRDLINLPMGRPYPTKNSSTCFDIYSDDLLICRGNDYKGISDITSDSYFYRTDTSVVFDRNNFLESASNLFLNILTTQIRMQLTHKLYGDREKGHLVNINDFFSYFENGHKLFFGWQNKENDIYLASIFIYNNLFDYSHLLTVSFSKDDIFNENRILQATFYAFTPHGNLKKE